MHVKLERVDTSGQIGTSLRLCRRYIGRNNTTIARRMGRNEPRSESVVYVHQGVGITTKVYLVPKSSDDVEATLDFTKSLILITNGESSEDIFQVHDAISGVAKTQTCFGRKRRTHRLPQSNVPGYEELIQNWEQEVNWTEEEEFQRRFLPRD